MAKEKSVKGIMERIEGEPSERMIHVQVAIPESIHIEVSAMIDKLKDQGKKCSWQRILLASTLAFLDEAKRAK